MLIFFPYKGCTIKNGYGLFKVTRFRNLISTFPFLNWHLIRVSDLSCGRVIGAFGCHSLSGMGSSWTNDLMLGAWCQILVTIPWSRFYPTCAIMLDQVGQIFQRLKLYLAALSLQLDQELALFWYHPWLLSTQSRELPKNKYECMVTCLRRWLKYQQVCTESDDYT